EATGPEGSLLAGGRLRSLRWSSEGLSVQADGVELQLGARFWFGLLRREARIAQLRAERVQVDDTRPPTPATEPTPLDSLALPMPIDVALSVKSLVLPGVALNDIELHYRYGLAAPGLGVPD